MLLTQQFSSEAFVEQTLWPKAGGFTIVIIPDLAELDNNFEPITNGEESLQDFVQSLGSADIDAEITTGIEFIKENCPFHPLGSNEADSTAAAFREFIDEHIDIAECTKRETYKMVQKIKDSTFPKIVIPHDHKEDPTLLKFGSFEPMLAAQIDKLTETIGQDVDVDAYIFIIPSLELIQDAAQLGMIVQPVYIDTTLNYGFLHKGETMSSRMAHDAITAIEEAFPGYIKNIKADIEWLNDAKSDYKYRTALTSQELAAQSALKFD